MTRHTLFRLLAALTLAVLLAWLGYGGAWDVFAVVGVAAALGGVVARPKREKKFRPDTWRPARDG